MARQDTGITADRSVADPHEMLAMQARWELLGPLRFSSPQDSAQFREVPYEAALQQLSHFCETAYRIGSMPEGWVPTCRNLQMVNMGNYKTGLVAVAQCPECGIIYWQRVVCRKRSNDYADYVCRLPRYHDGPCDRVPVNMA